MSDEGALSAIVELHTGDSGRGSARVARLHWCGMAALSEGAPCRHVRRQAASGGLVLTTRR